MPKLLAENETAWQVVRVCASQLRVVGMGTALGFDFQAILTAFDLVGVNVTERRSVFEKVRQVGEAYAGLLNRRAEEDRRAADPKAARTTKVKLQPPPLLKTPHGTAVRDRAEAAAARVADEPPAETLSAFALSAADAEALGFAVSSDPSGVAAVLTGRSVRLCPISTPPARGAVPAAPAKTRRRPNSA